MGDSSREVCGRIPGEGGDWAGAGAYGPVCGPETTRTRPQVPGDLQGDSAHWLGLAGGFAVRACGEGALKLCAFGAVPKSGRTSCAHFNGLMANRDEAGESGTAKEPSSGPFALAGGGNPGLVEPYWRQTHRHGQGFSRRQLRLQVAERRAHLRAKPAARRRLGPGRQGFRFTKDDVVKLLEQAVAEGAAVIKQQGDAGLDRMTPFGWEQGRHVSRNSYIWMSGIEHSSEHFGQLVVYYCANNLIPPESRR